MIVSRNVIKKIKIVVIVVERIVDVSVGLVCILMISFVGVVE